MGLRMLLPVLALLLLVLPADRADSRKSKIKVPEAGSVSREQGLAAWARIYEVASHPRCANCHVGTSDRPMWSGPSYGRTRPHGMNVRAGPSRIGAETLPCITCHARSSRGNDRPHEAPRVDGPWQLAPVEAAWFGRGPREICTQLRDPRRNGNRDYRLIAAHAHHDKILRWAWTPGGGREPAPYSPDEHILDILTWGVAGTPCPGD